MTNALNIALACLPVYLPMPDGYAQRMADAIYKAEGTRHPYGVLSVKVKDAQEARVVCLNSITNNWKRWNKAGRTNEFVDFMANRWCPVSADPVGNKNWKRNVKILMEKH